jgi:hypothetical protein
MKRQVEIFKTGPFPPALAALQDTLVYPPMQRFTSLKYISLPHFLLAIPAVLRILRLLRKSLTRGLVFAVSHLIVSERK